MDALRLDTADREDLGDLCDHEARGRCHGRIEVLGRAAVAEVPDGVGPGRVDEGDVGPERALEDVQDPVDLALLLAFRDVGPGSNGREEPAEAGSTGPDGLGQRSLWQQLVLQGRRRTPPGPPPDSR